tara:strand:- start:867 stop:1052 length:186 start_codon:yes stop_codon:yes gene_type:complete
MTLVYAVRVANYACDDGIAEWSTHEFDNADDAQEYIRRLDSYEEYELRISAEFEGDDDIPF